MSDLHQPDLDRALADLASDLSTHSSPPGAAAAIATARTRRRTRSGALALVAAVAVAAVAVPRLLSSGDDGSVAGDGGLPAAEEVSAAALTTATAGWTGAWADIDRSNAGILEGLDSNCLDEIGGPAAEPKRIGDRVFVSADGEAAIALFVDYDNVPAAADQYAAASARGLGSCGARVSTTSHGDAVVSHASADRAQGGDVEEVWFARLGNRAALFSVIGSTSPAPDEAAEAVTDLVLGALQEDSSFEVSSGALEAEVSGDSPGTTPSSFDDIPLARIREVTGDWSRDWTDASSGDSSSLPCFPVAWPEASPWGQGSTIGDRGTLLFAGTDQGPAAIDALIDTLAACQSVRWSVHPGAGAQRTAAWASSDTGSIFLAERGNAVTALQVRGLDRPTDEIAAGVIGLLEETLARPTSITVTESAPPEPASEGPTP